MVWNLFEFKLIFLHPRAKTFLLFHFCKRNTRAARINNFSDDLVCMHICILYAYLYCSISVKLSSGDLDAVGLFPCERLEGVPETVL